MRVLVCGGRDFTDGASFFAEMDRLHRKNNFTFLIEGGQRTRDAERLFIGGADYWAHCWAIERHIPHKTFPAEWGALGKGAGPRRNQQMLDEGKPDLVVAFPGGKGTANMVRRAQKAGVKVFRAVPGIRALSPLV